MRVLQHVGRHGGLAAELARERPFGADAIGQNAAEHARAGRRARDLLDLGVAVDRIEAHAERMGARDVSLLLDRIAEADAVRAWRRPRAPSRSRRPRRCRSRSRAKRAATAPPAPGSPSRRRTRACRAAPWRRSGSCRARRRGRRRGMARRRRCGAGSRGCARSWRSPHKANGRQAVRIAMQAKRSRATPGVAVRRRALPCDGDTDERAGSKPDDAALDWSGEIPFRTAGKDGQASSVPTFGGPARPKKPAPSLL